MARRRNRDTPPDPANDPAGVKLRRLIDRKAKKRSDAEIAREAGMTRATLSRLLAEDGPDPRLETLRKILKVLGATLSDFDKA